jgi:hypothetical protein
MSSQQPRHRQHPLVWVGVLLMHLGLLLGLAAHKTWLGRRAAALPDQTPVLLLRDVARPAPRNTNANATSALKPPSAAATKLPLTLQHEPADQTRTSAASSAAPTAKANMPAVEPTSSPDPPTLPAPAAQSEISPSPPPLNTVLPARTSRIASAPWAQRNPALDDPRANTPRASFESKLRAALAGSGEWEEQRIDGDRVRFRRGNTCIDTQRSRVATLNPFNQAASPTPWLVSEPKAC